MWAPVVKRCRVVAHFGLKHLKNSMHRAAHFPHAEVWLQNFASSHPRQLRFPHKSHRQGTPTKKRPVWDLCSFASAINRRLKGTKELACDAGDESHRTCRVYFLALIEVYILQQCSLFDFVQWYQYAFITPKFCPKYSVLPSARERSSHRSDQCAGRPEG